jgi:sRNA-binding carbon storage regulator CsrA
MLYITLKEGDYFVVGGNVKVTFERTAGQESIFVGVEAPREISVQRGQIYEAEIAKRAEAGDEQARLLSRELEAEGEKRRKRYNARRASRSEHERRIRAGEIRKPQGYAEDNNAKSVL